MKTRFGMTLVELIRLNSTSLKRNRVTDGMTDRPTEAVGIGPTLSLEQKQSPGVQRRVLVK